MENRHWPMFSFFTADAKPRTAPVQHGTSCCNIATHWRTADGFGVVSTGRSTYYDVLIACGSATAGPPSAARPLWQADWDRPGSTIRACRRWKARNARASHCHLAWQCMHLLSISVCRWTMAMARPQPAALEIEERKKKKGLKLSTEWICKRTSSIT